MTPAVSILGTAGYLPTEIVTSARIAAESGIPEQVIIDRFGVASRHRAAEDEHVCDMATTAGRRLLAQLQVDPGSIDVLLYFGSTWKEFPVWQAAPRIAHLLGCDAAFALELDYVSCGAPVALRIARDLLLTEPEVNRVLMVAASRESRLIDPANRRTRFALDFGDGAVATLLTRSESSGYATVLGSHAVTDGSFSMHVKMPVGGSVRPGSRHRADGEPPRLDVQDLAGMKAGLDARSLPAFRTVAEGALKRSGATVADLGFVCPIHMKRSMHAALLEDLGVPERHGVYLADTGHMSGVDPLFALDRAQRAGSVTPGSIGLLIAAGTGYTWAATCVRMRDTQGTAGSRVVTEKGPGHG